MSKSVKLSGADWKRFYNDPAVWGDETHWDDGFIKVDGKHFEDINGTNVADSAEVEVLSGYILEGLPGVPDDLIECIEWWLKRQTHQTLVAEVPKDKIGAATAALRALGVEVKIL